MNPITTPWKTQATPADGIAFAREVLPQLNAQPRHKKLAAIISGDIAAGKCYPHWPLAAAMFRDFALPANLKVNAMVLPEPSREFQRAYIGGKVEGVANSLTAAKAKFVQNHPRFSALSQAAQTGVIMAANRDESDPAEVESTEPASTAPVSPAPSRESVVNEWESAIAAELPKHPTRAQAVASTVKKFPELHRQYVAAVNNRGDLANTAAVSALALTSGQSVIQQWNAAVAAQLSTGKTNSVAIAAVVKQNPELHRRYLIEVNGRG